MRMGLVLLFFLSVNIAAAKDCSSLLLNEQEQNPSQLESYLEELLTLNLIQDSDLFLLQEALITGGPLPNPINDLTVALGSGARIHHEGLAEMLKDVDRLGLKIWVGHKIEERKIGKHARTEVEQKTRSSISKIYFREIPPNDHGPDDPAPAMIRIMPFLITQWHWANLIRGGRSEFNQHPALKDERITVRSHDGRRLKVISEFPQTAISIKDLTSYIEIINNLSANDSPLIYQMIVGHVPGATYRLPTIMEWTAAVENIARHSDSNCAITWQKGSANDLYMETVDEIATKYFKIDSSPLGLNFYGQAGPFWEYVTIGDDSALALVRPIYREDNHLTLKKIIKSDIFNAGPSAGLRLVQIP